jgi:hypothetical protein
MGMVRVTIWWKQCVRIQAANSKAITNNHHRLIVSTIEFSVGLIYTYCCDAVECRSPSYPILLAAPGGRRHGHIEITPFALANNRNL